MARFDRKEWHYETEIPIFYKSEEDVRKNSWKSNPRWWIRRSTVENAIYDCGNVLNHKNDAFLCKYEINMSWKKKK